MRDDTERRHLAVIDAPYCQLGDSYCDRDLYALAWSPAGDTLAVGGCMGRIYGISRTGEIRWRTDLLTSRRPGANQRGGVLYAFVERLAWSPCGHYIAASTFDHRLLLWVAGEAKPHWSWAGRKRLTAELRGVCFSPDSQWLVGAGAEGQVRGWRLAELEAGHNAHWTAPARGAQIVDMHWAAGHDGPTVAYADGAVRLWSTRKRGRLLEERCVGGSLVAMSAHPSAPMFALAGAGGVYALDWDRDAIQSLACGGAQHAVWRCDGAQLAIKRMTAIEVYAVPGREPGDELIGRGDGAPGEELTGRGDGAPGDRLRPAYKLRVERGFRGCLAYAPDGRLLAGALGTRVGALWRAEADVPAAPPPLLHPTFAARFSDALTIQPGDSHHAPETEPWLGAGERLWSIKLRAPIERPFTARGDRLYIGDPNTSGLALNRATGAPVWDGIPLCSNGRSERPATVLPVDADAALVFAYDGVFAVGAEPRWRWRAPLNDTPDTMAGLPAFANGLVFCNYLLNRLQVLDVHTGEAVWTWHKPGFCSAAFAIARGRLYMGVHGDYLVAIDVRTQRTLWSLACDHPRAMAVHGERLLILFPGAMQARALDTGALLWERDFDRRSEHSRSLLTCVADVVVGMQPGKIFAVAPGDGGLLWSHVTPSASGAPDVPLGLTVLGARLYAAVGRRVIALDARTGDVIAEREFSAPVSAAPVVYQGCLYVATAHKRLQAIGEGKRARRVRASPDALQAPDEAFSDSAVSPPPSRWSDLDGARWHTLPSAPAPVIGGREWTEHSRPAHRWTALVGASFGQRLLVHSRTGVVVAATSEAGVTALDGHTGARRWTALRHGVDCSSPACVGDRLLVATSSHLYGLDIDTGAIEWRQPLRAPLAHRGALWADDRGLAVLDSAGRMTWWSLAGTPIGEQLLDPAPTGVVCADGLWLASRRNTLSAWDPVARQWLWRAPHHINQDSEQSVCVTGDAIVAGADERLVCLDVRSGETRWLVQLASGSLDAEPLVRDGTLYIPSAYSRRGQDRNLFAVDPADGSVRWQTRIPGGATYAPLVLDTIIVLAAETTLLGLRRTDGRLLWRWSAPREFRKSPILCGELILVRAWQHVYALQPWTAQATPAA